MKGVSNAAMNKMLVGNEEPAEKLNSLVKRLVHEDTLRETKRHEVEVGEFRSNDKSAPKTPHKPNTTIIDALRQSLRVPSFLFVVLRGQLL